MLKGNPSKITRLFFSLLEVFVIHWFEYVHLGIMWNVFDSLSFCVGVKAWVLIFHWLTILNLIIPKVSVLEIITFTYS